MFDPNVKWVVRDLYSDRSMIPSGKGEQGKAPRVKWTDYQVHRPPLETYRRWLRTYRDLWGMVTGRVSDVVVVDVDPGADPLVMGDCQPHVVTPRGGGHYYFKHPGHDVKTVAGILPHIDIRGDGGFVNVVGTNPKTGGKYIVERLPTEDALFPWDRMPRQILDAMNGSKPASKESMPKSRDGDVIPEGKRNSTLASLAGTMRRPGMTEEEMAVALLAINASRCTPPLEEKEVRGIVRSVARYDPATTRQNELPQIIPARELAEKVFPELKFAIPDLLPEGLTILAGKPKSGKSWLALQMAYSVALGKNLLDGTQIERGEALVLALEDGERRLRDRIALIDASGVALQFGPKNKSGVPLISGALGHGIPQGLDLVTSWPRIGEGGIEQLDDYLNAHPGTRLIVIDIIKRITKKKGRGTAYDEDYDSIQPLQELAIRRGVAILCVHHVRKQLSDDPLDMVSGTFGLTGAADTILVLKRESGSEFRLSVSGRDVEWQDLAIKLEQCIWKLLGDADRHFTSESRAEILECIKGETLTPTEVSKATGKNSSTVKNLLRKMLDKGEVIKDGKGQYSARAQSPECLVS